MSKLTGFLSQHFIYILIGIVILSIVIHVIRKYKSRERTADAQEAAMKIRDDQLNEKIRNKRESSNQAVQRPYQIRYQQEAAGNNDSHLMQILEKRGMSESTWLYHTDEKVLIGERFGQISILNKAAGECVIYVELFPVGDRVCLKGIKGFMPIVKRGRRKLKLKVGQGVKLRDGDRIIIQESEYRIHFLKGDA